MSGGLVRVEPEVTNPLYIHRVCLLFLVLREQRRGNCGDESHKFHFVRGECINYREKIRLLSPHSNNIMPTLTLSTTKLVATATFSSADTSWAGCLVFVGTFTQKTNVKLCCIHTFEPGIYLSSLVLCCKS